jgi:hypothetical protein
MVEIIGDGRTAHTQLINLIPMPPYQDLDHHHHHLEGALILQPMLESGHVRLNQLIVTVLGVLEEAQGMVSLVTRLRTHR